MAEIGKAAFISGDWGTSRLRLFLCDATGQEIARADGEGAAAGDFAARFAALTADWGDTVPAFLCGMVGSSIGWREVPYLSCAAPATAIVPAAARFDVGARPVAILPGLSCRNFSGLPDVMRGEETQILGALQRHPALMEGSHLFCLPGTHTKWVRLEDGVIQAFQTALSGEMFDLLRQHSILARGTSSARADAPAFTLGLDAARGTTGLLHLLFSTRSRQLAGEIAAADAASYLSGLIIGADVAAARALSDAAGPVTLIGASALNTLYAAALERYGSPATAIDGETAARAGLLFAYKALI